MASGSSFRDMEKEAECTICLEFLTDPITLRCGHNFCRDCITDYCDRWEKLGNLKCPFCKAKIHKRKFHTNWQLANLVERIKENRVYARNLGTKEANDPRKEWQADQQSEIQYMQVEEEAHQARMMAEEEAHEAWKMTVEDFREARMMAHGMAREARMMAQEMARKARKVGHKKRRKTRMMAQKMAREVRMMAKRSSQDQAQ